MIKIRLQGTKGDLAKMVKHLQKDEMVEAVNFSKPFKNSCTNRYYRIYGEINFKRNDDED